MYIFVYGVEVDLFSFEFFDVGILWIIIFVGIIGDGLFFIKWLIRLFFVIRNWDIFYDIMVDGLNKKICLKYLILRIILFYFMKNCINMKSLYYMWL